MALAKGAKNNGVKIFEDVKVTGILKKDGKAVEFKLSMVIFNLK